MPCRTCNTFPSPTSEFVELGTSEERHGTLFQCRKCGTYIEVIAEERSHRYTPVEELTRYYPDHFRKRSK